MKTYKEIKDDHQKTVDDIIERNKVFFAFSKKQLDEGKEKIQIKDNKDIVSIGAGGFIPKENAESFFDEMTKADDDYTKELKKAKEAKEEAILYELNNHEAFYAGNIDPVVELFAGVYTKEEIEAVYLKHYTLNED